MESSIGFLNNYFFRVTKQDSFPEKNMIIKGQYYQYYKLNIVIKRLN